MVGLNEPLPLPFTLDFSFPYFKKRLPQALFMVSGRSDEAAGVLAVRGVAVCFRALLFGPSRVPLIFISLCVFFLWDQRSLLWEVPLRVPQTRSAAYVVCVCLFAERDPFKMLICRVIPSRRAEGLVDPSYYGPTSARPPSLSFPCSATPCAKIC